MAYDEVLAARIRKLAASEARSDGEKMFGGLAFLIGGNIARIVRLASVRRAVAGSSGIAVLAAWVACAERYATVGAGGYNDGIFIPLLLLAAGFTAVAGLVAVQAWKGASSGVAAAAAAVPAVAVVLLLALAIGLRG